MKKKSAIEAGVTLVLIVVLFFAANNSLNKARRNKRPAQKSANESPAAGKAAAGSTALKLPPKKAHYQLQEEETKDLKLKRNPFTASVKGPKKPVSAAAAINLSGILWDKDDPMAIVNNKIVKAGDRVGGCTVIKIKEESIVLNDGVKDFELRIGR